MKKIHCWICSKHYFLIVHWTKSQFPLWIESIRNLNFFSNETVKQKFEIGWWHHYMFRKLCIVYMVLATFSASDVSISVDFYWQLEPDIKTSRTTKRPFIARKVPANGASLVFSRFIEKNCIDPTMKLLWIVAEKATIPNWVTLVYKLAWNTICFCFSTVSW